jgi:hypothetical protein
MSRVPLHVAADTSRADLPDSAVGALSIAPTHD